MAFTTAEGHRLHREAGPARPGGGEAAVAHAHLLPGGDGGGGGSRGQAAAALHRKSSDGNFEILPVQNAIIIALQS